MRRKRRVIIAHGWNDSPSNGWIAWLARELHSRGFEVVAPAFPRPHLPQPKEWLRVLKEAAGRLDGRTALVGYSLGTPTTLRFLDDYPGRVHVAGIVLVAGFGNGLLHRPKVYFDPPLDFRKIQRRARVRVCIYSDNDKIVNPKQSQALAEKLEAESVVMAGYGHFMGLKGPDGEADMFPAVLDAVLACFDRRWNVKVRIRSVLSWPMRLLIRLRGGNAG